MAYTKNTAYVDIPFSSETATGDFYTYLNLCDLVAKCETLEDEIIRCRTIGMLQSVNGKFFLSEVSPESRSGPLVRLSVIYLKEHLPSTVIPYPVQVFGSLQWRNRPVIYAKIVQMINTSMALRLEKTMKSVTSMHLARNDYDPNKEETSQRHT